MTVRFLERTCSISFANAKLGYNIDAVNEYIINRISIPVRDFTSFTPDPRLVLIRSFDVNKSSVEVDELKGGIAGGSELLPTDLLADHLAARREELVAVHGARRAYRHRYADQPDAVPRAPANIHRTRDQPGAKSEDKEQTNVAKLGEGELLTNIGSMSTERHVLNTQADLAKIQLTSPAWTEIEEKVTSRLTSTYAPTVHSSSCNSGFQPEFTALNLLPHFDMTCLSVNVKLYAKVDHPVTSVGTGFAHDRGSNPPSLYEDFEEYLAISTLVTPLIISDSVANDTAAKPLGPSEDVIPTPELSKDAKPTPMFSSESRLQPNVDTLPRNELWAAGRDEAVEVNQRALIDKVLARYSGEFTVFRELLQNSDDAGANSVEIRFETQSYLFRVRQSGVNPDESLKEDLPNLKTAVVHQWTFKNNGTKFRDEDWNRLKKIAEGNPDEEKIGAFGVGFYSLFSVTEEPWVTSGVSSITFMVHLSEVSIYFDDQRLVRLSKRGDEPIEVPMLAGLDNKTPDGRMTVRSVQTVRLHIETEVARSVYTVGSEKRLAHRTDTLKVLPSKKKAGGFLSLFSGRASRRPPTPAPGSPKQPINLLEALSSSVVLTIFAANVDVRLDNKMTAELLRATKKIPPSRLRYQLTYMEKDEYDSSVKAEERATHATGSVFRGLRADLEGQVASFGISATLTSSAGLDLLGHSTGQTTGIGGHMATRFIPTVEREAIDLVDRNVAVWNEGLLHVGGFLARFAYEQEMEAIKKEWDEAVTIDGPGGLPDAELQAWLRARALHALKFFTFRPSTPSPLGIRSSSLVYVPDPDFSGFLKRLPVISEDVVNGANIMIAALRTRKMIKNIEFEDVLNGLRSGPLSETETIACLKWWIDKRGKNNPQGLPQLLDVLVVSINGPPARIMKFSDARTFLNPTASGGIPTDGPLPSTLLPTSVTGSFDPHVLGTVFPWKQLTVIEWLRYITDPEVASVNAEFNITLSISWAERVLSVLAKAWPSLPESAKDDVIKILSPIVNLSLFPDLPTVTSPSDASIKEALETVLHLLGVNKHADLRIIFERMIKTGDWTIPEFVKYLVSIQQDLTLRVSKDLRNMTAFPKEGTDKELLAATTSSEVQLQRYKVEDLYEPVDIFRNLGLPVIDWGVENTWKPLSDEAKFLFSLGLRRFPPLLELLNIAASDNQTVREKALSFFLDNLYQYLDYNPQNFRDLAFVPALRGSEKVLAKPFELYASPEWATLGFLVVDPLLRDDAASRLKLKSHPPNSEIVTLLKRSPPIDETTARQWFEVLSEHIRVFSPEELQKLSETPFVPVESTGRQGCNPELHAKLFSFVDFGSRANRFLAACGTKKEPSVEEIAQILLEDPRKFYELANGREHYLTELRNLAAYQSLLGGETIDRMKQSNMLLGLRRVKRSDSRSSIEDDEDHWVLQDDLLLPNEVAIADDTNAYQLFGDRVFCAPQEDNLEELYLFLGSPRLTSLIKEDWKVTVEIPSSTIGPEIRHLVLERLPLLLHGRPQSLTEVKTKVSFDWLNEEYEFRSESV
ncbi:hypothetical protein EDB87DRAFT_1682606 [Lactarius vividus]|nr:hypothetical protein EDB87DRAFT_1682606 [Lactarius vividus]